MQNDMAFITFIVQFWLKTFHPIAVRDLSSTTDPTVNNSLAWNRKASDDNCFKTMDTTIKHVV